METQEERLENLESERDMKIGQFESFYDGVDLGNIEEMIDDLNEIKRLDEMIDIMEEALD